MIFLTDVRWTHLPEQKCGYTTSPTTVATSVRRPTAIDQPCCPTRTSGRSIIRFLSALIFTVAAGMTGLAMAADDDLDITMTVISDPDTFDISNAKELQLPAALTIKKQSVAGGGESSPMAIGERRLVFDRPELPGLDKGTSSAISISAHPDDMDIRQPGFAGEGDAGLALPPESVQTEHEPPRTMETPRRERNTR